MFAQNRTNKFYGDRDVVMKIELAFSNVSTDIKDAIADIHVEDQSEADAPSMRLISKRVGPFTISKSQPSVTVDVDLNLDQNISDAHELSLIVRVKSQAADDQPIEFLNTTTTPLPNNSSELVEVRLSRIV
ncbi:MAG: hypothetical protein Kow00121_43340 [Elainellaceae cyanobacterium]